MAGSLGSRRSRTFPLPPATSRKVIGCPTGTLSGSTVALRFHWPTYAVTHVKLLYGFSGRKKKKRS